MKLLSRAFTNCDQASAFLTTYLPLQAWQTCGKKENDLSVLDFKEFTVGGTRELCEELIYSPAVQSVRH